MLVSILSFLQLQSYHNNNRGDLGDYETCSRVDGARYVWVPITILDPNMQGVPSPTSGVGLCVPSWYYHITIILLMTG
jgi:hypothetical protein